MALRKPRDFQAQVTIPTVQINPKSTQTLRLGVEAKDLVVKNDGPVVVAVSAQCCMAVVSLGERRHSAPDRNLEAALPDAPSWNQAVWSRTN